MIVILARASLSARFIYRRLTASARVRSEARIVRNALSQTSHAPRIILSNYAGIGAGIGCSNKSSIGARRIRRTRPCRHGAASCAALARHRRRQSASHDHLPGRGQGGISRRPERRATTRPPKLVQEDRVRLHHARPFARRARRHRDAAAFLGDRLQGADHHHQRLRRRDLQRNRKGRRIAQAQCLGIDPASRSISPCCAIRSTAQSARATKPPAVQQQSASDFPRVRSLRIGQRLQAQRRRVGKAQHDRLARRRRQAVLRRFARRSRRRMRRRRSARRRREKSRAERRSMVAKNSRSQCSR